MILLNADDLRLPQRNAVFDVYKTSIPLFYGRQDEDWRSKQDEAYADLPTGTYTDVRDRGKT